MKLSDILTTSQLADMREISCAQTDAQIYAPLISDKIQRFIYSFACDTKCVLNKNFWASLNSEYSYTTELAICIIDKKATVMQIDRNTIFARHLGEMLKRGYSICVLLNKRIVEVNWDNWNSIYRILVNAQKKDDLPEAMSKRELRKYRVEMKREHMFEDAAQCIRYHKLGKRGFNTTFDELRAQHRVEEYEKFVNNVRKNAKAILGVL